MIQKLGATTAGQYETLSGKPVIAQGPATLEDFRNKLNEVVDAVNKIQSALNKGIIHHIDHMRDGGSATQLTPPGEFK